LTGKVDPGLLLLRQAQPADNTLLAEMGARMFADTFASQNTPEDMAAYLAGSFSPEIQATELADPETTFYIAEIGGQPVGYVRVKLGHAHDSVRASHPMEIVRIYTDQSWQGRGLGAALMIKAIDHAREHGCDAVWLDVWEKNPKAIQFYSRFGFVTVGDQSFQLGDDSQHDLIMQLNLIP
jgi:GNAT superfamily N-acetyltransferase